MNQFLLENLKRGNMLPAIFLISYLIFLGPLISQNIGWDMPDSQPGALFVKPGINFIEDISEEFFIKIGPDIVLQPGRYYPTLVGWLLSTILLAPIIILVNAIGIVVLQARRRYAATIAVALYLLISPWLFFLPSVFDLLGIIPLEAPWGGPWGFEPCGGWICIGRSPSWGGWLVISIPILLLVFALNHAVVSRLSLGNTVEK